MAEPAKKKRRPRAPRIAVSVTSEIIERSTRANSRTCMIAEAIKAAVPHAKAVSVDLQTCRFTDHEKGLRYVYLTPRGGQRPLIEFDSGINPAPFEMTLHSAHVTRVRGTKSLKHDDGLSTTTLRKEDNGRITRVGGRSPPQMKTQRRFGLRAYAGFETVPLGVVKEPASETER